VGLRRTLGILTVTFPPSTVTAFVWGAFAWKTIVLESSWAHPVAKLTFSAVLHVRTAPARWPPTHVSKHVCRPLRTYHATIAWR